jgi:RNA polymerase sigma-70 factor (ECF subfamily)
MALAGDSGAFAALVERYRSHVWRTVTSVARGPDAEDLAQEAIIRAYCSLKRFRGDAPFQAWLCRIALNAAHDYQRSAWRRRVVQDNGEASAEYVTGSPEAEVNRRETVRRVRFAVAGLGAQQRTPIWLHYFEQFSFAEIARLERTSESTIRSRIKAGLKRLHGSLDDLIDATEETSQPQQIADEWNAEKQNMDETASRSIVQKSSQLI